MYCTGARHLHTVDGLVRAPISNLRGSHSPLVFRSLTCTPTSDPPRYGFNPGSTLAITPTGYAATAARATICTTISAAFGGMVTVIITKKLDHIWDLGALCNGILAGLVSITAGCATVLPWHSMFIGSIGGLVYLGGSRLELKFKVYIAVPWYLVIRYQLTTLLRTSLPYHIDRRPTRRLCCARMLRFLGMHCHRPLLGAGIRLGRRRRYTICHLVVSIEP